MEPFDLRYLSEIGHEAKIDSREQPEWSFSDTGTGMSLFTNGYGRVLQLSDKNCNSYHEKVK